MSDRMNEDTHKELEAAVAAVFADIDRLRADEQLDRADILDVLTRAEQALCLVSIENTRNAHTAMKGVALLELSNKRWELLNKQLAATVALLGPQQNHPGGMMMQ